MKFSNPYWGNKTKIELLERWLIVESYVYYDLSDSLVDDSIFDANALQLVQMMKDYADDFKESFYYKTFKGFDGSTGFDLMDRLEKQDRKHADYIKGIAAYVSHNHAFERKYKKI
jgi:hypothetical protein